MMSVSPTEPIPNASLDSEVEFYPKTKARVAQRAKLSLEEVGEFWLVSSFPIVSSSCSHLTKEINQTVLQTNLLLTSLA
jgi:hypothetical protein